jgi:hypothetical protein
MVEVIAAALVDHAWVPERYDVVDEDPLEVARTPLATLAGWGVAVPRLERREVRALR